MWLDNKKPQTNTIPSKYNNNQKEWYNKNPKCKFILWNKEQSDKLWQSDKLNKWKPTYDKITLIIEKCDITRYAILYIFGGLYHDLDVICNKSVEPLIQSRGFGWSYEAKGHSQLFDDGRRRISNSIMFSKPEHQLWPKLLDFLTANYDHNKTVFENTGPTMLSKFVSENNLDNNESLFVSPCLLLPLDDQRKIIPECPSNALSTCYTFTRWNEGTGWGFDISDIPKTLSIIFNLIRSFVKRIPTYIIICLCLLIILFIVINKIR